MQIHQLHDHDIATDTNAEWMERRTKAIPKGLGHACHIFAERAENSEIWDIEGTRYIDFAGGIAVMNTGHVHPKVTAAVQKQSELFSHTAFQVMPYKPYIELAERLNLLAPGPSEKKSIFFSTGAEAVENAVKIARAHTKRPGVITFIGGFHQPPATPGSFLQCPPTDSPTITIPRSPTFWPAGWWLRSRTCFRIPFGHFACGTSVCSRS